MTDPSVAPVVVFAHRRPDHLRRTLDALAQNHSADRADVTVICDGPRSSDEAPACHAVVCEAERERPFGKITVNRRGRNLGLAQSIVDGVSRMLGQHERVIVLEDDIVTSPAFLTYMNEGLERYSADNRVISLHGYSYPTELEEPFFLRGADCWGWATWRRGWEIFNPDGVSLLQRLRDQSLTDAFDFNGAYPYTRMLEDQIAGRNDSWAVRWYASAFLADKLTLYPGRSLVQNIGNDGSGTHSGATDRFEIDLAQRAPDLSGLVVKDSAAARSAFERYFQERDSRGPVRAPDRLISRIRRNLSHRVLPRARK